MPQIFIGLELPCPQLLPEPDILRALCFLGRNEHPVMPADDLAFVIAHGRAEIGVGRQNDPVQVELDDALRFGDRIDAPHGVSGSKARSGHIGRELDELDQLAVFIQHRIVAGPDPYGLPQLGLTAELGGIELAGPQLIPEPAILAAGGIFGRHKNRMGLIHHLFECVSHKIEEIGIGSQHASVDVKFNDSLRRRQRRQSRAVNRARRRPGLAEEKTSHVVGILLRSCSEHNRRNVNSRLTRLGGYTRQVFISAVLFRDLLPEWHNAKAMRNHCLEPLLPRRRRSHGD